ncbi:MAG: chromosomal replication initiator protein DnaA [Bacteroidota bacterium]|nr:chromosomal replication initiator protein DnaA [Bacteroidota bacterium]
MTTNSILKALQKEVTTDNYDKFLKQLVYKDELSTGQLAVFEVPNNYVASFIKSKFTHIIQNTMHTFTDTKPDIKIVTSSRSAPDQIKTSKPAEEINSIVLNPAFTFDSFVVGSSNQMAYSASQSVCLNQATQFNPLFIYGGTGLGKTHLLQAIGNDAQEKGKTVIYVTCEEFMNSFVHSIKKHDMDHFRSQYRKCDLLLIDDVQFLSGKDRTQEEFFFTFNELHTAQKQIVLTADKIPSKIAGLQERLQSRFLWGLMAHVESPKLQTRIAIIEKKCELNKIKLTQEIIHFIATNFDNSIREIEGALVSINAHNVFLNKTIDLDLVKNVLKEQIREMENIITIPMIINTIAQELNIKPSFIKSKRTQDAVYARQIATYLASILTHNSMPDIAKHLGMKDRSSVSKNITKVNQLIDTDDHFRLLIDDLKNKFTKAS